MMKFLKIVFVALSIFFVFDDECGHGVAAAFIVPSSSTAPPCESLSFASSLFQKQQRMSEANFRLDYIQGINRSPYNKNKKTPPSIVPVEDDDKNEHIKKEGTLVHVCVCVCLCCVLGLTYNAMQYNTTSYHIIIIHEIFF
jgi:hypothetical protein